MAYSACRKFSAESTSPQLQQRNRRVESHRQLVRPLAIHYARLSRESSEDLQQAGMLGLIRAAELYRQDRKTPFEAFARPHIRGAILHYLRDVSPLVRLPRRQAELQDRVLQWQRQQAPGLTGSQALASMRQELGISTEQLLLLQRNWAMNRATSLETERIEDWVSDEEPGLPAAEPTALPLESMLAVLDGQQQLIVRRVVLEGWSYRKLALDLGVSPMTVQRRLHKGLERLRQHLDGTRESHPETRTMPMGSPAFQRRGAGAASVLRAC